MPAAEFNTLVREEWAGAGFHPASWSKLFGPPGCQGEEGAGCIHCLPKTPQQPRDDFQLLNPSNLAHLLHSNMEHGASFHLGF